MNHEDRRIIVTQSEFSVQPPIRVEIENTRRDSSSIHLTRTEAIDLIGKLRGYLHEIEEI